MKNRYIIVNIKIIDNSETVENIETIENIAIFETFYLSLCTKARTSHKRDRSYFLYFDPEDPSHYRSAPYYYFIVTETVEFTVNQWCQPKQCDNSMCHLCFDGGIVRNEHNPLYAARSPITFAKIIYYYKHAHEIDFKVKVKHSYHVQPSESAKYNLFIL